MSKKYSWGLHVGLFSVLCLVVIGLIAGNAFAAPTLPSDGDKQHVKLVGWNDMQGRECLQVTTLGDWAYCGHHQVDNKHFNPITGVDEWNGTSIFDISDPKRPRLVWHIPSDVSANCRAVQVAYNYKGTGKDYLIQAWQSEESGPSLGKYKIFDITNRDGTFVEQLAMNIPVAEITATPADCGTGCGGTLTAAHKSTFSPTSGLLYTASNEPGFVSNHLVIYDLTTMTSPGFVARGWIPGQKVGDDVTFPDIEEVGNFHHAIVDEAHDRVYGGFRGTGEVVIFDFDPTAPVDPVPVVTYVETNPPFRATHTAVPVVYDFVPDIEKEGLPRTYLLVCDEGGGSDYLDFPAITRPLTFMYDISDEKHPFNVSIYQADSEPFRFVGGRFGVHNIHETVNGELADYGDKLVWFASFNAGVRVVDISNPYHMVEVGYYVPKPTALAHSIGGDQPIAIQINDVDVDYRGLAYASDRTGSGFFVFEYTGKKNVDW